MIFYFSATGNSKRVAEIIAGETGDGLVSIAEAMVSGNTEFDLSGEERIGFVTPTYFYNPPRIVTEFVEKAGFEGAEGKYAYVVVTLGTRSGSTGRTLANQLAGPGIDVVAQFSVRTQYTYIPQLEIPDDDELKGILDSADDQARTIAGQVMDEEKGDFNRFAGVVAAAVSHGMVAAYDKASRTSVFSVSEACDGCGLCTRVCPDGIVTIGDSKPVWNSESCTMCLACLHRCPRTAIDIAGSTEGKRRYVNPRTEIPDGLL